MGEPKALLRVGEQTFIERIIAALVQVKMREIIVVLGRHAEEIGPAIEKLPVRVVVNADYQKGQLSSLQAAIRSLRGDDCDGILVHLVDHPFVNPDLVEEMVQRFYDSKSLIVVPICKGRRGHPVILSRRLFSELLAAPLEAGAKQVVHAHRAETLEIETSEPGVVIDIDTPADYKEYVKGD